ETSSELTGSITAIRVDAPGDTRSLAELELAHLRGKPLDRDALREKLGTIMRISGVADVTARAVQQAGGLELIVEVTMHPPLRTLAAIEAGGRPIEVGALAPEDGIALDPPMVQALALVLRERYLLSGHVLADV